MRHVLTMQLTMLLTGCSTKPSALTRSWLLLPARLAARPRLRTSMTSDMNSRSRVVRLETCAAREWRLGER